MKILIGYDGSTYAETAIDDLQWAGIPPKAEAIVISSIEWPTTQAIKSWGMVETDFSPEWTKRIAAADALAEAGSYRLQKLFPNWNIQIEPSAENPAEAILEKAKHWPADLIVVGTHGRSALARAVLGSVSLQLVREASCPVRVARAINHNDPQRLLIGIDGSPEAEAAVREVCRRSWHAGTEIRILAVHEALVPLNAERIAIGDRVYEQINKDELIHLRAAMDIASEKFHEAGLLTTPIVEQGDPKHALLSEARNWNADTIFLGSRGLGRAKGFLLGSVSSSTVAHAPCTVEVVHAR